eukprot:scaffold96078_cov48-Prasinocladus_malaysianus.AAC.1
MSRAKWPPFIALMSWQHDALLILISQLPDTCVTTELNMCCSVAILRLCSVMPRCSRQSLSERVDESQDHVRACEAARELSPEELELGYNTKNHPAGLTPAETPNKLSNL